MNEKSINPIKRRSNFRQFINDLFFGFSVSCLSKTLISPAERVRLYMITQNIYFNDGLKYKNYLDCFNSIHSQQGIRGFWRGNLINSLRYSTINGSILATNDFFNNILRKRYYQIDNKQSFCIGLLSGGLSGLLVISSSIYFTRNYQCWELSVIGSTIYRAGQLGIFKHIQDSNPYRNGTGNYANFTTFGIAIASTTIIKPFAYIFDTIRREMMLNGYGKEKKYKNNLDCFDHIYKTKGIKGLYNGLFSDTVFIIGNSLVLFLYDRFKFYFRA